MRGKAYRWAAGSVLVVACAAATAAAAMGEGVERRERQAKERKSPARKVGYIRHPSIRESSGLVASRRFPGVFWTHNDKGNAPVLYAINRAGSLLTEFRVDASHEDWEDVATDDAGNLYVGNIGNNEAARGRLEVHRLSEPDPAAPRTDRETRQSLKPDKTWRLRFAGKPFDCESLFVHEGYGYVVSKVFDGRPATLHRFPLEAAGDVTLEEVATLPTRGPVTAADVSPDGSRLIVLTYGRLYTFEIGGDPGRAGVTEPTVVRTPRGKLEGACFSSGGIVLSSEGRDLYFLPGLAPGPANRQRRRGRRSGALNSAFERKKEPAATGCVAAGVVIHGGLGSSTPRGASRRRCRGGSSGRR
jgi:hypothetical protein